MKRDLTLTSKIANGISPGTYTTTQTGTGVDCRGFEYAIVIVHAGTFTLNRSVAFTVETSTAVGGTYAAVTDAAFTAITTANDVAIYRGLIRLDGTNQFLRIVGTATGADGNAVYGVTIELLNGQRDALAGDFAFKV